MPQMIIVRDSRAGKDSVHGSTMNTFTGDVWIDPVLASEGISVANVNFTPCARTHWHYHGGGQLLRVIAGSSWICDKGGEPQRINVGDVVWCPPGTTHWHGADDASYMVHQAVSHGKVEWYDAVSDEVYSKKR
jgi:quercetin dioxygenase-like cupin family protein